MFRYLCVYVLCMYYLYMYVMVGMHNLYIIYIHIYIYLYSSLYNKRFSIFLVLSFR